MAARNAKRSISTILRKNRGPWTVYVHDHIHNIPLYFYFQYPAVKMAAKKLVTNKAGSMAKRDNSVTQFDVFK